LRVLERGTGANGRTSIAGTTMALKEKPVERGSSSSVKCTVNTFVPKEKIADAGEDLNVALLGLGTKRYDKSTAGNERKSGGKVQKFREGISDLDGLGVYPCVD